MCKARLLQVQGSNVFCFFRRHINDRSLQFSVGPLKGESEHVGDFFVCLTKPHLYRRRRFIQEMTEHQAIGAALARDDALCGQNGMGEIEAAELEAELDAILRAERALQGALRGPTVPASAGASPTTAASASAVGGAVVGRPAAPARPTASTPSPSMTGAVPERRAVREPA